MLAGGHAAPGAGWAAADQAEITRSDGVRRAVDGPPAGPGRAGDRAARRAAGHDVRGRGSVTFVTAPVRAGCRSGNATEQARDGHDADTRRARSDIGRRVFPCRRRRSRAPGVSGPPARRARGGAPPPASGGGAPRRRGRRRRPWRPGARPGRGRVTATATARSRPPPAAGSGGTSRRRSRRTRAGCACRSASSRACSRPGCRRTAARAPGPRR